MWILISWLKQADLDIHTLFSKAGTKFKKSNIHSALITG